MTFYLAYTQNLIHSILKIENWDNVAIQSRDRYRALSEISRSLFDPLVILSYGEEGLCLSTDRASHSIII